MSKIKFNKEWYNNNRVAVNCKTKEEAKTFIIELAKIIGIAHWFDKGTYYCSHEHGEETCYSSFSDKIVSDTKSVYIKNGFLIINFSDLEFEDEINHLSLEDVGLDKDFLKNMINEDDLGYEEFDNSFNNLEDVLSNIPPKKSVKFKATVVKPNEPIETDTPIKRTILRGDVKLEEGDIVCCYTKDMIGIITQNYIMYNNGDFDLFNDINMSYINNKLLWILPKSDMKNMGYEVGKLLFKGEMDDNIKDLIIHIPKKTVEVFSVKFCKTDLGLSHFISDSEEIFVEDIVSPIRGEYEDLYGEVINIQCKELSEEELKSYNKIIKIK